MLVSQWWLTSWVSAGGTVWASIRTTSKRSCGSVAPLRLGIISRNTRWASCFTDGNAGETIQWPDAESPYSNVDNLDCYGENKAYRLEAWTRYPETYHTQKVTQEDGQLKM